MDSMHIGTQARSRRAHGERTHPNSPGVWHHLPLPEGTSSQQLNSRGVGGGCPGGLLGQACTEASRAVPVQGTMVEQAVQGAMTVYGLGLGTWLDHHSRRRIAPPKKIIRESLGFFGWNRLWAGLWGQIDLGLRSHFRTLIGDRSHLWTELGNRSPLWAGLGDRSYLCAGLGDRNPLWAGLGDRSPLWARLGIGGPPWARRGNSSPLWAWRGNRSPLWARLGIWGPPWAISRLWSGARACTGLWSSVNSLFFPHPPLLGWG